MGQAFPVEMPGGYWQGRERHRQALLRPLTGGDEAALSERRPDLRLRLGTELLARTLLRVGPCTEVDEGVVRGLTAGDREALLLHLRRISVGERMQAVVTCPAADCAERMDVDLEIARLLLPAYPVCHPRYEVTLHAPQASYQVAFHVPTGDDLEAAAARSPRDAERAAGHLLQCCVEEIRETGGDTVEGIPDAVAHALPAAMAERDPQAEVRLDLTCPRCGLAFLADLDATSFLMHELCGGGATLFREVHRLAVNYHWSEADILSLDLGRRRTYLGLIAEAAHG